MSVREAADPNRAILSLVAHALGDLCEELVFVGGCATGLLVTSVRAQTVRMTEDVDLVAQVTTAQEYHAMESRLASKGFKHDMSPDAPICRWRCQGIEVDLMPSGTILGFHNRWYPLALATAEQVTLEDGLTIRLIAAPVFVGTKLEAFKGRKCKRHLLNCGSMWRQNFVRSWTPLAFWRRCRVTCRGMRVASDACQV